VRDPQEGSPNDTVTALSIVMAGLVPAIYALPEVKKVVAGTSLDFHGKELA